jgi:hypothetical protein
VPPRSSDREANPLALLNLDFGTAFTTHTRQYPPPAAASLKEAAVTYQVNPVGHVASRLVDRAAAPKQGREGAPDAWLVFDPAMGSG